MGLEEIGSSPPPWQQQVLDLTRLCQEQRDAPLLWAVEVGKCLQVADVAMPSVELGQLLISHMCWRNNGPMLWKYIEQAMGSNLVHSLQVLALLTSRIVKAVDDALQLSQAFGMPVTEFGQAVVVFVFTVVSNLVDATLEDWGLQVGWSDTQSIATGNAGQHDMEIEVEDDINEKRRRHREHLWRTNTVMAVEVFGKFMEHKRTSTLLRLARRNL